MYTHTNTHICVRNNNNDMVMNLKGAGGMEIMMEEGERVKIMLG